MKFDNRVREFVIIKLHILLLNFIVVVSKNCILYETIFGKFIHFRLFMAIMTKKKYLSYTQIKKFTPAIIIILSFTS